MTVSTIWGAPMRTEQVDLTGYPTRFLVGLAATAATCSAVEDVRARWADRLAARRIVAQVLWDATGHPTDVPLRGAAAAELGERMADGRVPITSLPSTLWKAVTA